MDLEHEDIIRLLLESGADSEIEDRDGLKAFDDAEDEIKEIL